MWPVKDMHGNIYKKQMVIKIKILGQVNNLQVNSGICRTDKKIVYN